MLSFISQFLLKGKVRTYWEMRGIILLVTAEQYEQKQQTVYLEAGTELLLSL